MVSVCSSDVGNPRLLRLPWLPPSSRLEATSYSIGLLWRCAHTMPLSTARCLRAGGGGGGGGKRDASLRSGCFSGARTRRALWRVELCCVRRALLGLASCRVPFLSTYAHSTQAGTSTSPLIPMALVGGLGRTLGKESRRGRLDPPRSGLRRCLRRRASSLSRLSFVAWHGVLQAPRTGVSASRLLPTTQNTPLGPRIFLPPYPPPPPHSTLFPQHTTPSSPRSLHTSSHFPIVFLHSRRRAG